MHCRPFTDFMWQCQLIKKQGVDIGQTYRMDKACTDFVKSFSAVERNERVPLNKITPHHYMEGSLVILRYYLHKYKKKIQKKHLLLGTAPVVHDTDASTLLPINPPFHKDDKDPCMRVHDSSLNDVCLHVFQPIATTQTK